MAAALLLTACHKDKYKTEPTVEIKSFGPSEVSVNGTFDLTTQVTDDEGDALDSIILVYKVFNATTNTLLSTDSTKRYRFSIANFGVPTGTRKYDLAFKFAYSRQDLADRIYVANLSINRNVAFGIILIDKDKHRSEYKETDKILLKQ